MYSGTGREPAYKTVAEGIETQEQLAYVNSMHCDVIQGFYFSRPLPLKEFETWADTFVFPDFEINMCGGVNPCS